MRTLFNFVSRTLSGRHGLLSDIATVPMSAVSHPGRFAAMQSLRRLNRALGGAWRDGVHADHASVDLDQKAVPAKLLGLQTAVNTSGNAQSKGRTT
jgi:hypothetical protein